MAPVPGDSPKTPAWHVDAARGPSTPSFDHLVGAREQRGRHLEGKRLGGLEVEHRLVFGRCLHCESDVAIAASQAIEGTVITGAAAPSGAGAVRLNHPRLDLVRSIGVCPASPPTP